MENGLLTIRGGKDQERPDAERFIHRGIATRNFEHRFQLSDHIRVDEANLKNGLLNIHLVREIPEALKPRTIEINHES